jgi:hypothetical protein
VLVGSWRVAGCSSSVLGTRTAAMGRVDETVPWKSLVSLSWGPSV